MSWWWKHNVKSLPSIRPDERKFVEDLTGCNPLLLRPLLRAKERQFIDCKDQFLASEELVHVRTCVLAFLAKKQETWGPQNPNLEKSCVRRYSPLLLKIANKTLQIFQTYGCLRARNLHFCS